MNDRLLGLGRERKKAVLTLVEKFEVSKIPIFDLDHLRELGYKFVLKDEVL